MHEPRRAINIRLRIFILLLYTIRRWQQPVSCHLLWACLANVFCSTQWSFIPIFFELLGKNAIVECLFFCWFTAIFQIVTHHYHNNNLCFYNFSLKLECEKLAQEKTEIQRQYIMVRQFLSFAMSFFEPEFCAL